MPRELRPGARDYPAMVELYEAGRKSFALGMSFSAIEVGGDLARAGWLDALADKLDEYAHAHVEIVVGGMPQRQEVWSPSQIEAERKRNSRQSD